eukprot:GGOE01017827.1.p1 GENE.GGOE01017827.1~~GGOE01017827.1.p1  ORF type:complete len:565 (-),score=110.67 GGOE01017827.1:261-1847(-)
MARLARVCRAMQRLLASVPPLSCRLPRPYQPLTVSEVCVAELQGVIFRGNFWEMNLLAVTSDQTRLFVAKLGRLYMYKLPLSPTPNPAEVVVVDPRGQINQIATGFLGDVEVVIAVTHQRRVVVLCSKDLTAPPLLAYVNQESSWSIACHAKGRLAVGSNAHNIVTFRLQPQQVGRPQVLRGHRHNIPCVCYSPCGLFLASTSIDGSVRLWDVETIKNYILHPGHEMDEFDPNDVHWGWALAWLPLDSVQVVSAVPPVGQRGICHQQLLPLWDRMTAGLATLKDVLWTHQPPMSGLPTGALNLLSSHFLLHCRSHHLLLLRLGMCGMETVAMVDVLQDMPPIARQMVPCRLALAGIMPELSAVAVSTQGNGLVLLYKVVQTQAGAFLFVLQQVLEPFSQSRAASLAGMVCVRDVQSSGHCYTLYAVDQEMQVTAHAVAVEGIGSPSARSIEDAKVSGVTACTPGSLPLPPTVIDISASFIERFEYDDLSPDTDVMDVGDVEDMALEGYGMQHEEDEEEDVDEELPDTD